MAITIAQILSNMTTPSQFGTLAGGGTLRNSFNGDSGQVRAGNWQAMYNATVGQGHNPYFVTNVASVVNWALVYAKQGHNSTNTRVIISNMFTQVMKPDYSWAFLYQNAAAFGKRVWRADDENTSGMVGGNLDYSLGNLGRSTVGTQQLLAGGGLGCRPAGDFGYEVWPNGWSGTGALDFYGAKNKALLLNHRMTLSGVDLRLEYIDPSGAQDMGNSFFVAQLGQDFYADPNPGKRYITDTGVTSNNFGAGFPYGVLDANFSSWLQIPTDGSTLTLTCVSADAAWLYEADLGSPYILGTGQQGKSPYNKASLGHAEYVSVLYSNPPLSVTSIEIPIPEVVEPPSPGNWLASLDSNSDITWSNYEVSTDETPPPDPDPEIQPPTTGIVITPVSVIGEQGAYLQFYVEGLSMLWSSDDESLVTIDSTGLATIIGDSGTVVITATDLLDENNTAVATITLSPSTVTRIQLYYV